jgi:hypothetical protein
VATTIVVVGVKVDISKPRVATLVTLKTIKEVAHRVVAVILAIKAVAKVATKAVDKVVHVMAVVGAHVIPALTVRYVEYGAMMLWPASTASTRCINLMIIAPEIPQSIKAKRCLIGS